MIDGECAVGVDDDPPLATDVEHHDVGPGGVQSAVAQVELALQPLAIRALGYELSVQFVKGGSGLVVQGRDLRQQLRGRYRHDPQVCAASPVPTTSPASQI